MNILVTGGAGFIGSHVVDILINAGHQVSIVDNLWKYGGGRIDNINPQAQFYNIDICSHSLAELFDKERPEIIFHYAAQHSVKISMDNPEYDAKVNIFGLLNVLNCAVRCGTQKIIFASSGATYGSVKKMPINENTPQHPESPYGTTKMASEYYIHFWKEMYNLNYTIFRYGNVYGPRQDPTGEAGVIAIFTHSILLDKPVRIDWDGKQKKDYVYVRDVAFANLLAIDRGENEIYCIASGKGTSVNSLYHNLIKIIGHDVKSIQAPKRPGDIYLSYFDCSKAEKKLGWRAKTELKKGLHFTADYFKTELLECAK